MTPEIEHWFHNISPNLTFGHVLEVGSLNVNGTVRPYIGGALSYLGTDMRDGPGVDQVINNSDLLTTFGSDSFDTIICCETLEHDLNFLQTLHQMRQMLRAGGLLFITTPTFGFPLHRYPYDYWRFGEDAYRQVFFSGMDILALDHLPNAGQPDRIIAGLARS